MNEIDDRLAGDPVWELFGQPTPGPATGASRTGRFLRWTIVAALAGVSWLLSPSLGVVVGALAIAVPDFRKGRRLARSIPVKAGGTICARFAYAWAAWKLSFAALGIIFASVSIREHLNRGHEMPPELVAGTLLCPGGFILSAAWTALGLVAALRSGMRIWIGEGVNRAGTLVLSMLIVGFTFAVILPISIWLVPQFPRASDEPSLWILPLIFGSMFAGPVLILIVLERIERRVIAEHPGKFGPKVPTVGKWDR